MNGIVDNNTIIAHNDYLKKKKKQERQKLKAEKRKGKAK